VDLTHDIGTRTDVQFAALTPSRFGRYDRLIGLKLLIVCNFRYKHKTPPSPDTFEPKDFFTTEENGVLVQSTSAYERYVKHLKRLDGFLSRHEDIESYWWGDRHEDLLLDWPCNTGTLAVRTILSMEPEKVFIAGFDFFTLGISRRSTWRVHNPHDDKQYFIDYVLPDKQVECHEDVLRSFDMNFKVKLIRLEDAKKQGCEKWEEWYKLGIS
jgi:hypothetical protein